MSTWNTCRRDWARPWLVAPYRRAHRRRRRAPRDAGEVGGCVWRERGLSRVALIPLAARGPGCTDRWAQRRFCSRREVIDGARQVLQKKQTVCVWTVTHIWIRTWSSILTRPPSETKFFWITQNSEHGHLILEDLVRPLLSCTHNI